MSLMNWHEESGKSITASEWNQKFKSDVPHCLVCRQELTFRGLNGNNTPHFLHPKDTGCPTVEKNSERYRNLRPVEEDQKNAKRLKEWVLNNGYSLYRLLCDIAGFSIKFKEFTEILLAANRRRIWYYVGLTEDFLPYTLLVNYGEFEKTKDRSGREEEMYMALDSEISSYTDLWIRPTERKQNIFRIFPKSQSYEKIKIGSLPLKTDKKAPEYFQRYLEDANLF